MAEEHAFPFPRLQHDWPDAELADSQSKRRLVVLLADISDSMNEKAPGGGTRIEALNAQLKTWVPSVQREGSGLLRSVEFAIITFGLNGVQTISGNSRHAAHVDGGAFIKASQFQMGPFTAGGTTPMAEAIRTGIGLAQDRQRYLRDAYNLTSGQPRLIMFSDGMPTGHNGRPTEAWQPVAEQLHALRKQRRLYFLAFGVPGVNRDIMERLAPPGGFYELEELDFERLLNNILMATTADNPYAALDERYRSHQQ